MGQMRETWKMRKVPKMRAIGRKEKGEKEKEEQEGREGEKNDRRAREHAGSRLRSTAGGLAGVALLSIFLTACSHELTEPPPVSPTVALATSPASAAQPSPDDFGEPLLTLAGASPAEGKAPLSVEFNVEIEGGTPPFRITWRFGDDSPPVAASSPTYTYASPGRYRAEVAVHDGGGDSDTDWIEITVLR